jgi:hypothetical protein
VGTLLARLSRSSDPLPAPPPTPAVPAKPRTLVLVPPPTLLVRLLFSSAILMVVLVTAGMVGTGVLGVGLVERVRAREAVMRAKPEVAIPAPAVLLDRDRLAAAIAAHPAHSGRFLAARARAVADAAGGEAAAAAWNEAERSGGLLPADRLDAAELLVRLRRPDQAETYIRHLDWATLDQELRARATDLLGRCLLLRHAGR